MATTTRGVRIPTSGRDWQLYTVSMNCGAAAKACTSALRKGVARVMREGKKARTVPAMAKVIGDAFREEVEPTLAAQSRFGAYDSEPCRVAHQALIDAGKRLLGIDYYCPELGDWL